MNPKDAPQSPRLSGGSFNPDEGQVISWRPWGAEAFEQARREGKLVFLSISAAWCHWCHVMDEESFAHPEVIRRIHADFIPVRVDSDKRPDINQRYNMGGWPTMAVLDAAGQVVIGGTYMPAGQLMAMLSSAKEPQTGVPLPARPPQEADAFSGPSLDESLVETVAGFLDRAFDPDFGGFGGPPKFPQAWAVELALHLGLTRGDKKRLRMATFTLDNMREGEICDIVEGGFFRYAVGNEWDNPHSEKLLEVNAQALALYLRACHLTGSPTYRATARGILDYLFCALALQDRPWLCGSQSADRDYYHLSEEERVWAESPTLDTTLYTDRNAMTASALFLAHWVLGEARYRDHGFHLVDFLWGHCYQPERGMFHYDDGKPSLFSYLSDQVRMVGALLDAYEAAGGRGYLDRAQDLVRFMDRRLWDREQGGYRDTPGDDEGEEKVCGLLKVSIKPFAENALAAVQLNRLYHLTGLSAYREQCGAALKYLATVYLPYKHHAAPFGVALCRFLESPHHLVVVGKRGTAPWQALVQAAHRLKAPWKVVLPLDIAQDRERIESLGYPVSESPRLYPCIGTTCLSPISQPEDLPQVFSGKQL